MSRWSMLRAALVLAWIHAQTPPPVSGPAEPSPPAEPAPPAEPSPDAGSEPSPPACADDATWHKKGDEAKNCQWVSELLPTRCDVHGDSQTAQEACRKACDTCESELPPPRRSTFAPTVTPSEEEECRTDICLDRDNDCCAPLAGEGAGDKPEPRGCSIPGFVVKPDPTVRSGWAPCHAAFGKDATYKCCRDTEFANPNEVCRSDICKDRDDDCCATGGEQGTKNEPRGCKVDGYEVTADMHGRSGWAPCKAAFGQDAIYQCCIPKSEYKETCRSDICVDRDSDCCAPEGEKRGCGIAGYHPAPDPTGKSGWAPCKAAFGQGAIYQCCGPSDLMEATLKPTQKPTQAPTVAAAKKKYVHSSRSGLQTFFALVLILVIIISIMVICARCKREQRSNQRSFEMTDRQSSYEPPVVHGERVPTPMGRVPQSKLDSPRGAVV